MTGAWNTEGTVSGKKISFSSDTSSDSYGYINYTFNEATLNGKILTFTYRGVGSLKDNGVLYPYSCNGNVTATKID